MKEEHMYRYETIDDDYYKYRLYEIETGETVHLLDEVGICFSYEQDQERSIRGTLLKHGDSKMVKEYYEEAHRKFKEAGLRKMSEELRYIEGKFDVEELNKIIEITGYVGKFYEDLIQNSGD